MSEEEVEIVAAFFAEAQYDHLTNPGDFARSAIAALDKYREGKILADPNMDRRAELGGLTAMLAGAPGTTWAVHGEGGSGTFTLAASPIQDDQEKEQCR